MDAWFANDEHNFGAALLLSVGIQICGWVFAVITGLHKWYDLLGSVNTFTLLIFVPWDKVIGSRLIAILVIFYVNRFWLFSFLTYRAINRDGDTRMAEVAKKPLSFLVAWILQALWVWAACLPMLYAGGFKDELEDGKVTNRVSSHLKGYDAVALFLGVTGVIMQIWADYGKNAWVNAGRPGGFYASGPWGISRHPNYAGEIQVCWCLFFLVLPYKADDWAAWFTIIGPMFTTFLLIFISGLPLAEGKHLQRYYKDPAVRANYEAYRRRTPILLPCIPSVYENLGPFIRTVLFMEWPIWEYKKPILEESIEEKTENVQNNSLEEKKI